MTFLRSLDRELDRCGYKTANRHFEKACVAVLAHDDVTFAREMAAFRKIAGQWGDCRSGTVAGAPSGPSRCASQAKPLIDYRKENDNGPR